MRATWPAALAVAVAVAGCVAGADVIGGVPSHQHRAISRTDFPTEWPFSMNSGLLGCDSGAVVFRAVGVTYALNDAARRRGFEEIARIRLLQPSPPPTNPLKGVNQDIRMAIYKEAAACGNGAVASQCRQRVRERRALTDAQLSEIEAEGVERIWPPNQRGLVSLEPIVEAGLKLCRA